MQEFELYTDSSKLQLRDVTLANPDYIQGFDIYTDSSKLQLGAVKP